jgi:hypothetical protein
MMMLDKVVEVVEVVVAVEVVEVMKVEELEVDELLVVDVEVVEVEVLVGEVLVVVDEVGEIVGMEDWVVEGSGKGLEVDISDVELMVRVMDEIAEEMMEEGND